MKKSILNLEGVEQLSKNEKKSVNGGRPPKCIDSNTVCYGSSECLNGQGCFIQTEDSPAYGLCKCL